MPTVIYDNYEWDSDKNKINKQKHNIDFETAIRIFEDMVIEAPCRDGFGEGRRTALGRIEGKGIVIVYTYRSTRKRIISARKARKNEQKAYEKFWQENNEKDCF